MRVLDLFSGVGGFSIGLERAGMRTVAFCEIEPYCRAVLRKHWPGVPIYDDVRELTAARLARDGITDIDLVCGGFPCQDISVAGSGAGIHGERSGLWGEFARLIGEVRPRYALIENVPRLLSGRTLVDDAAGSHHVTWMGRILGDLAALGMDAEWHCIPAASVGAPHLRDRIWIAAYARSGTIRDEQQRRPGRRAAAVPDEGQALAGDDGSPESLAYADGGRRQGERQSQHHPEQGASGDKPDGRHTRRSGPGSDVADTDRPRLEGWLRRELQECARECAAGSGGASGRTWWSSWWSTEPDVGRVAISVPSRAHRLRALGNAVVPPLVEIFGRAILRAHERSVPATRHDPRRHRPPIGRRL